ncbi:FUSC family protein [Hymenobacter sediminis]|uniref:FUSC family protein n=1 Tax=Hymenobacter sediminis TaxID=2218621 RepID=UPI000DA6766A|nr:FUSC family protein [Hymenobacter sediminis]RPD45212.1 FUSC family protein [Hymenobacter sediminis]
MSTPMQRYVPRTRRAVRSLIQLHPAPWRWKVGMEAGLALGLPLGLFTALGQQGWGLQAGLGAFTALYGASLSRRDRMDLLPLVAAGLVLASALGVACAGSLWLSNACLVVVSAVACVVALGIRLGPPGPMMFVLVSAVSAHLARPKTLGGVGLPGLPLVGLVAVGAALAYLVIIAPLLLPSVRRRHGSPSGLRVLYPHFKLDREVALMALRVVMGVLITCLVSRPLGAHRTYWVVLSAVAVLQSSASRQLTTIRGLQRMIGTLLGIGVFELLTLTQPSGLWLVALLMVLQAATEVVVARNYALALLFITPMALLNSTAGHPGNTLISVEGRVFDTLLGATIALLLFWLSEWLVRRLPLFAQPKPADAP